MNKLLWTLLVTFTLAWLAPAEAQFGLFGSKKPKTPPQQRVPELIMIAKTDQDERKRTAAVEELREYDTKMFGEIVPVLVDVARSDSKPGVRLEAINSLAKIRPVSQNAGQTLEWAAAHDDNWKVRWQAKSSLVRYGWAGYHAGKGDPNPPNQQPSVVQGPMSPEPPLYDARSRVQAPGSRTPGTPVGRNVVNNNPPLIVNQPAVNVEVAPRNSPPPLIVDAPGSTVAAPPIQVPTPPPPLVLDPLPPVPPAVSVAPAPSGVVLPPSPPATTEQSKTTNPPAANAPRTGAEPNFRPAGPPPPRFSTAIPQAPRNAPPVTNDAPPLMPPM